MWDKCFDRVVVIFEGEMVFSGRTADAEAYFIEQGWEKKARQTTPDFLTSCTSVTERKIRDGHHGTMPSTPAEMAAYFKKSPAFARLQSDIAEYKNRHASSNDADEFRAGVAASKAPLTGKANAYKVNFFTQVGALVKSQARLQVADPRNFIIRIGSNCLQATLVGAVCYKPAADSAGSYTVAGAIFFSLLYFVIFAFGEIPSTVMARPLLIKHRTLGFYVGHPAAYVIAQMVSDAPVYALQTLVFSSIFYFLVGLNSGAAYFVMYRAIGSWSPNLSVAVRYGGFALALILTVAGFMLPAPNQHRWASWMRRISVPAYGLEALLANEFRTRTLTCSAAELVPSGPSYTDIAYQGCTITGGVAGSAIVSGADYLRIKYQFLPSHIWRNIGIIWAFYVIYAIFVVIGSSLIIKDNGGGSSKIFKRGAKTVSKATAHVSHVNAERVLTRQAEAEKKEQDDKLDNAPVFTFKDVRYTVQVDGKDKVLLNGITGLPGKLTALMGASGAGKTTLLDTISKRKTVGKIEGELLIDGRELDSSFSRRTGFAQQGDIFSALLRQDGNKTREEKLMFAEEVIDLLELGPIADALVGNPEVGGLGVEERKRLTIGVELAAHPDFLLFLDERLSIPFRGGAQSIYPFLIQAAYEIVRFLRKIAASGIAVLCTIHQPSGDLFEMFDAVVLLAPGGNTVYAGPTGPNASIVTSYFGRLGAPCPPDANPAEHIISTVAPVGGTTIEWPRFWRESEEAQEIYRIVEKVSARSSGQKSDNQIQHPAFAAPFAVQVTELLKSTTKLMTLVFFGMFIGFYNYLLPSSIAGVEAATLALLTISQSAPPLALDIAINFQEKFNLYVGRERNGIYSWHALVTALIMVEIPILFVGYTLLFLCYYWTIGFGQQDAAVVGGLGWLLWMVYAVFTGTSGTLLGAVSPTPFSVPFILSVCWNMFNILSWCLVSWSTMPSPFHWFFSWLSPLRWFFGSLMSSHVFPLVVKCTEGDLTRFNVPVGQTCAEYAAPFLATAVGYLSNPEDTSNCGYCQMSSGGDYVGNFGYKYDQKWRDWGIFICFCVSNVAVIYGATWYTRIRPLFKS
ncbi:hypothetical protein RQP46_008683 [Phenoliferia psychrophenolica]